MFKLIPSCHQKHKGFKIQLIALSKMNLLSMTIISNSYSFIGEESETQRVKSKVTQLASGRAGYDSRPFGSTLYGVTKPLDNAVVK